MKMDNFALYNRAFPKVFRRTNMKLQGKKISKYNKENVSLLVNFLTVVFQKLLQKST